MNGAEETLNEFGLLVGEALTDAFTDFDAAIFEFDNADRDAVDVENDVGTFFFFALDGDFFGDREVVCFWGFPVDQLDGSGGLAGAGFDLDAVVEKGVDGFVVVVKAAGGFVGFGTEFVEGLGDLGGGVVLAGEVVGEELFFDVAVARAVLPVAKVVVVEFGLEEGDYSVLGGAFGFTNAVHGEEKGGLWLWILLWRSLDAFSCIYTGALKITTFWHRSIGFSDI